MPRQLRQEQACGHARAGFKLADLYGECLYIEGAVAGPTYLSVPGAEAQHSRWIEMWLSWAREKAARLTSSPAVRIEQVGGTVVGCWNVTRIFDGTRRLHRLDKAFQLRHDCAGPLLPTDLTMVAVIQLTRRGTPMITAGFHMHCRALELRRPTAPGNRSTWLFEGPSYAGGVFCDSIIRY